MSLQDALAVHGEVVRTGGTTPADIARSLDRGLPAVMAAVLYLAKADLLRLPEIGPRRLE